MDFYNLNNASVKDIVISEIHDRYAIGHIQGMQTFLPISEIKWCFINEVKQYVQIGRSYKVKIIGYDSNYNNLIASIKQSEKNDYSYFKKISDEFIKGYVYEVINNNIIIQLVHNEYKAKAILPSKEIATTFYLDYDVKKRFFEYKSSYTFNIKNFDDKHELIFVSRPNSFSIVLPA